MTLRSPIRACLIGLMTATTLSACAASEEKSGLKPNVMVAAADPRAVEAGLEVLKKGGNAIDAAIAVQTVLTLVEPQSSGIGGGALALVWSAKDKTLHAYDGREMAPASAGPDLFLSDDGAPLGFRDAVAGGKSVGVPGIIAMLEMMHGDLGQAEWNTLFGEAERLADEGFEVGPRLAAVLEQFAPYSSQMPDTRNYFYGGGDTPVPAGTVLQNPDYAATMRLLAQDGARGFYSGALAEAIADKVTNAPRNPTLMTTDDLAAYQAKKRDALCMSYRVWSVCGFPPPTSGGLAIGQILGSLERFDMANADDVQTVHLVAEAARLAYADRELFVGDPDHVDVPSEGMLNKDYLAERSRLIDPGQAADTVAAGNPWDYMDKDEEARAPDQSPEMPGTSHFTIVDAEGNIVSMTTTIESAFGSHLMVGGFLLNNELTDFSFEPERDGVPVANAVAPIKRPRSSMSPTIVFQEDGEPHLAIGSPGGSRIPLYVTKALIGLLDQGKSVQDAISAPNHVNRGRGVTELEKDSSFVALQGVLESMGHTVKISTLTSGLHGIRITSDGLEGAADPRRDGVARSARVE
jgi:gamma-glutamyltranspeptidase/glutathione hydrolase